MGNPVRWIWNSVSVEWLSQLSATATCNGMISLQIELMFILANQLLFNNAVKQVVITRTAYFPVFPWAGSPDVDATVRTTASIYAFLSSDHLRIFDCIRCYYQLQYIYFLKIFNRKVNTCSSGYSHRLPRKWPGFKSRFFKINFLFDLNKTLK